MRHFFRLWAVEFVLLLVVLVSMSSLLPVEKIFARSQASRAGEMVELMSSGSGIMNAVVYDVTHQRYFSYNTPSQFVAASSVKVPIMMTFLDMVERQSREISGHEMQLLTTMIENSNNDSASALYGEVRGAAGVEQFMQSVGIGGLIPYARAWGWSLITPLTMVKLMTCLYNGCALTERHRQLALYLMEHVEPDQQVGVGDTAPAGATVAMKDGWVVAPDGLWAVNSSGIVMAGGETYIIAVYTKEEPSLQAGQNVVRQVCRMVASKLL
ncbi:MAG TPA: serine hydrolase [Ktedonobacteraceae bacterium]|nr:serine hydrolase [Ktedonobacteraceae bacterium]